MQLADDFAITWGGAPWVSLRSLDGVRVRFAMITQPVLSDANAVLDVTLERLTVLASFTPATPGGPAELDVIQALQLQGANALPGRALSANGETLEIAGDHLRLQLPLAQVTRGELLFDALHPRIGALTFASERALLTSAAQPLVTLSEGGLN